MVSCITKILMIKNKGGACDLFARGSAVVSRGYAAGHDRAGLRQYQARNPRRTPAATAEPITPATFGPIACMSR